MQRTQQALNPRKLLAAGMRRNTQRSVSQTKIMVMPKNGSNTPNVTIMAIKP
jgi:hypothetical protein